MRSIKGPLIACLLILLGVFGCSEERQTEDQARQQAASIKVLDIPLDSTLTDAKASTAKNMYVVFDGSGSMSDKFTGQDAFASKIEGAKWALHEFMKEVPADVNLGLYVFDHNGDREVLPIGSNNRAKFLEAIDSVQVGGNTPLGEAIEFGTDQLVKQYQRQLGYGDFKLVVVTDGAATGMPISEAAPYALQHRIPISTIGVCVEADHPLRLWSISYKAAENAADLKKGLEDVMSESPTFDPTSFAPDSTAK